MSVAKKQEYYVKRVNKANSSPSKAIYWYFYHCSACIMYISMNFSTPVRWHSAMRLFIGYISRLSEASLVCVFSLCLQLTWKQGSKSIDGYWTHNDCMMIMGIMGAFRKCWLLSSTQKPGASQWYQRKRSWVRGGMYGPELTNGPWSKFWGRTIQKSTCFRVS